MNVELLNKFLEDLSYYSEYEFLEEATNKELQTVAKKFGIKIPNNDLAIFKCIYAYVDRANKNGCILPREEVEKAITSLRGKPIDYDHVRQRTVGYWLDAKLEKDKIIAYGIFFKSNLQDDYELIKDLLKKNNLKISFEAWGNREHLNDGTYNLRDIEFCGGALLLTTKPAFEGAEVMEIAKEKVLEFASVMTPPKSFVKEKATYKCSCIKCGYETTIPDGEHCNTYDYGKGAGKCPKCGGQMRRADRPGVGQPAVSNEEFVNILEEAKLPKQVTECVRQKTKEGMSAVEAVKTCWLQYKKDNKEKSTEEDEDRFIIAKEIEKELEERNA